MITDTLNTLNTLARNAFDSDIDARCPTSNANLMAVWRALPVTDDGAIALDTFACRDLFGEALRLADNYGFDRAEVLATGRMIAGDFINSDIDARTINSAGAGYHLIAIWTALIAMVSEYNDRLDAGCDEACAVASIVGYRG